MCCNTLHEGTKAIKLQIYVVCLFTRLKLNKHGNIFCTSWFLRGDIAKAQIIV